MKGWSEAEGVDRLCRVGTMVNPADVGRALWPTTGMMLRRLLGVNGPEIKADFCHFS